MGSRPTRRTGGSGARRTIRVFTEGEKTEVQYLKHWQRDHRLDVNVSIDDLHGVTPLQLVEAAVADKKCAVRDQRKGRGQAPDTYWCVFDVDEHLNIPEAVELAAREGIYVAISNPCVEIWLLWHYQEHQRWDHHRDIQANLKTVSGIDKTLSPDHLKHLLANFEPARRRAHACVAKHEREGNPAGHNPSSDMWRVVDAIRAS